MQYAQVPKDGRMRRTEVQARRRFARTQNLDFVFRRCQDLPPSLHSSRKFRTRKLFFNANISLLVLRFVDP
jgi:hypothetical protein